MFIHLFCNVYVFTCTGTRHPSFNSHSNNLMLIKSIYLKIGFFLIVIIKMFTDKNTIIITRCQFHQHLSARSDAFFGRTAFGKRRAYIGKFWPNFSLTTLLVKLNCQYFCQTRCVSNFSLGQKVWQNWP